VDNSGNEGFDPSARDNERDAASALEPADEQPDVLLDVSELRVDELSLEVEDLRARVSTQADVLSLLRLHVGVEAELGGVTLTIKGVEAKVLLQVRLDNIAKILDRVMTTIDNNPDIVGQLTQPVGEAVEEVGAAGQAVGELETGAGSAVEGARKAGTAVGDVGAGQAVDDVAEEAPRQRPSDREPPQQPTERAPEGRRRGKTADSPGNRPARGSRTSRPRRSEEG
jgi:hypothetical protein